MGFMLWELRIYIFGMFTTYNSLYFSSFFFISPGTW